VITRAILFAILSCGLAVSALAVHTQTSDLADAARKTSPQLSVPSRPFTPILSAASAKAP
jgi:hypothetical protein